MIFVGQGLICLILKHPHENKKLQEGKDTRQKKKKVLVLRGGGRGGGRFLLYKHNTKVKALINTIIFLKKSHKIPLLDLDLSLQTQNTKISLFCFSLLLAMTSLSLGQHPKAVHVSSLSFKFLMWKKKHLPEL